MPVHLRSQLAIKQRKRTLQSRSLHIVAFALNLRCGRLQTLPQVQARAQMSQRT